MEKTILRNSFHNTEYHSRKSLAEIQEILETSKRTDAEKAFIRKVRKALCPVYGCKCGQNELKMRK